MANSTLRSPISFLKNLSSLPINGLYEPLFFKELLYNKARRAIGMANINAEEFRSFSIPIPHGTSIQYEFAAKLELLDGILEKSLESQRQIELLFDTILHQAFSGGLTAKWREAHMNELLAEMEEQARALGVRELWERTAL